MRLLLLTLAVTSLAAPAAAQDLHLVVEGIADAGAFRAALEADLGRGVTDGPESPPLLRIELASDGTTAHLRYTDEDGAARERVAELTPDADAAMAELTLLASNLVRDQASALIADAAPQEPTPEAVERASEPAPVVEATTTVVEEEPLNFALAHPLRLGVEGVIGLQLRDPDVQPFGDWGMSIFGTIHEAVALGVTRLNVTGGYSSLEGTIFAVSGAPALELYTFIDPRVQLWGQAGVSLQGRTPNNIRAGEFQAAPFLAAGARFWVASWFSLSVQLAVHLTVTDAYRMGPIDLPQWSTPGTLGLAAEFHIDP